MKYCYECGRITVGEPLYCNSCGRSYDVKLCPRHHVNPRVADVCSQCGSRDLSTPQPKVSVWWRVLEFLARVVLGLFFAYVALAVLLGVLEGLLSRPEAQNALLAIGLLVVLLWWLWSKLPDWIRKLVRRSFERKEHNHER